LFAGHEWTSAIQQSKTPTTLPGQHDFYAYRLTSRLDLSNFFSTLSSSPLFPNSRIQVHGCGVGHKNTPQFRDGFYCLDIDC
jgi:hypothetical protein